MMLRPPRGGDERRTMPRGTCKGCGGLEYLPPFGDGMCFLCATDGPPGEIRQSADRVVDDGPEADELDRSVTLRCEILDEFADHQSRWERAIGQAHYRSQRFKTWTLVRRRREVDQGPFGPTVEELRERELRRDRARAAEAARRARVAVLVAQLEAKINAPSINMDRTRRTREKRRGAGNYVPEEKIAAAISLRRAGKSIRDIAKETGLSKVTVQKYVDWVPKPEAMRRMHARLRAEGRGVLPPWRRTPNG